MNAMKLVLVLGAPALAYASSDKPGKPESYNFTPGDDMRPALELIKESLLEWASGTVDWLWGKPEPSDENETASPSPLIKRLDKSEKSTKTLNVEDFITNVPKCFQKVNNDAKAAVHQFLKEKKVPTRGFNRSQSAPLWRTLGLSLLFSVAGGKSCIKGPNFELYSPQTQLIDTLTVRAAYQWDNAMDCAHDIIEKFKTAEEIEEIPDYKIINAVYPVFFDSNWDKSGFNEDNLGSPLSFGKEVKQHLVKHWLSKAQQREQLVQKTVRQNASELARRYSEFMEWQRQGMCGEERN